MKIGISLNEVLRDFNHQFIDIYTKYIDSDCELKSSEITSTDLIDFFKFKDIETLNMFMYEHASLELFGHADICTREIVNKLEAFLIDLEFNYEEEIEVFIVSKEVNKSIPSTMFFLSKTGIKIKNYRFDSKVEKLINDLDVLITASPEMLENANNETITIKIETPYNSKSASTYKFDRLHECVTDDKIVNNIVTKILKK